MLFESFWSLCFVQVSHVNHFSGLNQDIDLGDLEDTAGEQNHAWRCRFWCRPSVWRPLPPTRKVSAITYLLSSWVYLKLGKAGQTHGYKPTGPPKINFEYPLNRSISLEKRNTLLDGSKTTFESRAAFWRNPTLSTLWRFAGVRFWWWACTAISTL